MTVQSVEDQKSLNELVFKAALEGILVCESVRDGAGSIEDLRFVDANPSALRITGRDRDDVIGKRLSEAFPGNFDVGIFDRYKTALDDGQETQFEVHYTLDGFGHWFSVLANPVSADLLIITFVDVSGVKRSAVTLEQREAELRFILDSMPARIWYKDDQNKIIRLNQAAADAMGMSVDDAEGENTYDLFPAIAAEYHRDDLTALDGGKPLLGIIERFVPKDGEQGWLTTDKIPFKDPNTEDPRLLVVSTDITRQKTAEDELRIANDSLAHFASIAAHDLQAPLRQIAMMSNLLTEELNAGNDLNGARSYAEQIEQTASRLRKLVSRLLEFSKVGSGALVSAPVGLRQVIAAATEQSMAAERAGVAIDNQVAEDAYVRGDHVLLSQVFANLIDNAIKYGHQSDVQIKISSDLRGGLHRVRFWDNGPGIDPNFAERIFEVFSQLVDTDPQRGVGIGLAFCRKVVTRHGGQIWLDQNETDGTCFVLTLIPSFTSPDKEESVS